MPEPVSSALLLVLLLPAFVSSSSIVSSSSSTPPSGFEGPVKSFVGRPSLSLSVSLGVSQELSPFPFFDLRGRGEGEEEESSSTAIPASQERGKPPRSRGVLVAGEKRRRSCTYTVSIKTSCSSPRITRDMVSLSFGDAYGNEVYVARLDDPATGTFERCSTDTFRMAGACSSKICFLYLRRSGRDGWTPESVKVYSRPGSGSAVTFFYNTPLPDGIWYGFNLCHDNTNTNRTPHPYYYHREQQQEEDTKNKIKIKGRSGTIRLI